MFSLKDLFPFLGKFAAGLVNPPNGLSPRKVGGTNARLRRELGLEAGRSGNKLAIRAAKRHMSLSTLR